MTALMAIDPAVVDLSRRVSAKTGSRASEIYAYAIQLVKNGIDIDRVEEILTEMLEVGGGLSLHEIMELVAQQDES
jgi:hypothetical protein